jgi:hypothetical protein
MSKLSPRLKRMCKTCPWRKDSPYAFLRPDLERSALTEASRVCHSTGSSVIYGDTGKPERLCRGACDAQNKTFFAMGYIEAPTDEAWQKKVNELKAEGQL